MLQYLLQQQHFFSFHSRQAILKILVCSFENNSTVWSDFSLTLRYKFDFQTNIPYILIFTDTRCCIELGKIGLPSFRKNRVTLLKNYNQQLVVATSSTCYETYDLSTWDQHWLRKEFASGGDKDRRSWSKWLVEITRLRSMKKFSAGTFYLFTTLNL